MQFKGYFGTTPIFDRESLLANLETAPPFDLVYGRILHEVHGSNIVSARDCSMKDCQTMFADTACNARYYKKYRSSQRSASSN
jgi:hypothetical protein